MADKKKNVLVVFVDELRTDALRCYGNEQVITPALDRLAATAEVFDEHCCSYPVCTPSRFTFFTGLYANEHAVWTNKGSLMAGCDTWAKTLQRNGWHTQAVGKMHAYPTYTDFGFDEMRLSEQDGDGRFEDDYHQFLYENGKYDTVDIVDQRGEYRAHAGAGYRASFGTEYSNLEEKYHSTSWVTEESLKMLDKWDPEGGNVLFSSYIKPHHPFDPVKRFVDMYDGVDIKPMAGYTDRVPSWDWEYSHGYFDNSTLTPEVLKKMTLYYYANLTHIDEGLGRMIDKLKEKGLYDDTMIVFTADHGDFMGFHHMALKANHMYDPIMRIPLIIKKPGETEGKVCHALSDNTDTSREILREMGLSPVMNLQDGDIHEDAEFVPGIYRRWDGEHYLNDYMVRSRRWKLLLTGSFSDARFFDLEKDPLEMNDLSSLPEHQEMIGRMKEWLSSLLIFRRPSRTYQDYGTPVAAKSKEVTEEQHERLEEYFLGCMPADN